MNTTAAATRSRIWTPVLAGLRAEALDCLQANLAALADHAYGIGSHLALGAALGLPLVPGEDGLLRMSVPLADRLAEAEQLLGLTVRERHDEIDGADLVRLATDSEPIYVVADAFGMCWLPTAGKQHLEHSFLLIGAGSDCLVVDGYHNATPWGDARPGVWRLPASELATALPRSTALRFGAAGLPEIGVERMAVGNAAALADSLPLVTDYLAELREHRTEPAVIEGLVLDSWLLGRSRELHARWLESVLPGTAVAAEAVARADSWAGFAVHSYVAGRRAGRGAPLPDQLFSELAALLLADADSAGELARSLVRELLVVELAAILGSPREELADDPSKVVLRELPNFNSFRLVDLIERAEDRLAVQVDPDRLSGDNLRDLVALGELFLPGRRGVLVS